MVKAVVAIGWPSSLCLCTKGRQHTAAYEARPSNGSTENSSPNVVNRHEHRSYIRTISPMLKVVYGIYLDTVLRNLHCSHRAYVVVFRPQNYKCSMGKMSTIDLTRCCFIGCYGQIQHHEHSAQRIIVDWVHFLLYRDHITQVSANKPTFYQRKKKTRTKILSTTHQCLTVRRCKKGVPSSEKKRK